MSHFNIRQKLGIKTSSPSNSEVATPSSPKRTSASPSTASPSSTRSLGSFSGLLSRNSSTTTVDNSSGQSRRLSFSNLSEKMGALGGRRHSSPDLRQESDQPAANPSEFNRRNSAPEMHDLAKLNAVEKHGIADPTVESKSFLRRTFGLSEARARMDARLSARSHKPQSEVLGTTKGGLPVKLGIEYDKKAFVRYMSHQPNPTPLGYVEFMHGKAKINLSVGIPGRKPNSNDPDRQSESEPAFGARPPQPLKVHYDALKRNDFLDMLSAHKMPNDPDMQKNVFKPGENLNSLFGDKVDQHLAESNDFKEMVKSASAEIQAQAAKDAALQAKMDRRDWQG